MDFFQSLEIMLKDFEKHLGWKHPEHCGSGLQIVNIVKEFEENRASADNSDYTKSKSCANCSKLHLCDDVRRHPELVLGCFWWHCGKHDFA